MQQCKANSNQVDAITRQLQLLHATQTQPFAQLVQEYGASLYLNRELQVRCVQLDKEAAELRDEVASLNERLRLADEAKAAEWKAQAEAARREVTGLTRELDASNRERDLLRSKVTQLSDEARASQETHDATCAQLEQVQGEASLLRDALAQTSAALEHERASRIAAASEVQAALEGRESALVEAERLRAENSGLSRRLVQLKEHEIERMNEINKTCEEMLAQAAAVKREAESDREAALLIRNKAGVMAAATLQAAAAAVGLGAPQQPAAAAAAGADGSSGSSRTSGGGGGWLAGAHRAAAAGGFTAPAVLGRVFGRTGSGGHPPPSPSPQLQQPAAATAAAAGAALSHPLQLPAAAAAQPADGAAAAVSGRNSSGGGAAPAGAAGSGGSGGGAAAGPSSAEDRGASTAGQGLQSEGSTGTWDVVHLPGAGPGEGIAVDVSGLAPVGLRELMGLPPPGGPLGGSSDVERRLPTAPYRGITGHRGGCCALAMQQTGHLMASCGADHAVAVWDLTVMRAGAGPHLQLHGMTAGVNDVQFVADGTLVLAAGTDRSLRLWSATTGVARHTLTGHSGAVICCAASPLDSRCAASVSEDRSLRLWDLARGYSVHSVPCAKMPNALAMSGDGNTIATGHVDGSVCLWDVRQCWRGHSQPLADIKVMSTLVTCLSATRSDSLMLCASKDGSVMLWDFRMQQASTTLRAPRFTPGTHGSMGRGRCHMSMSHDGRWVAAGGADGGLYVWDLQPQDSAVHSSPARSTGGPSTRPPGGFGSTPGTASGSTQGPRLSILSHHKDSVVATSWAPDSSVLVSADKTGVVAFWSLAGWSD